MLENYSCTLMISGIVSLSDYIDLFQILETTECCLADISAMQPEIFPSQPLDKCNAYLTFDEVEGGVLDEELEQKLKSLNLNYIWAVDITEGLEIVTIYDAERKETQVGPSKESSILVSINDTPETVGRLRYWDNFLKDDHQLFVFESNHQLMSLKTENYLLFLARQRLTNQ